MPATKTKTTKKLAKPASAELQRGKPAAIKEPKKEVSAKERYIEAVGRRKTSIARVRMSAQKEQSIIVNEKPFESHFQDKELRAIVLSPLEKANLGETFGISVLVKGGGIRSQAEAVRHGLARALVEHQSGLRSVLKAHSFLTRDPRMRERKKFGLRRARRARQWRKR